MKKSTGIPPSLAKKLLTICTQYDDEFNVIDTLHEIYRHKHETDGKRKANLWYWRQVLCSIPKSIYATLIWRFIMLKNYLKIVARNILLHKGY